MQKSPTILENEIKLLFGKYNDPIYAKIDKSQIEYGKCFYLLLCYQISFPGALIPDRDLARIAFIDTCKSFDDQKELYGTVSDLLFSRGITTKYCARSIDAGKSENLETIATSTLYIVE